MRHALHAAMRQREAMWRWMLAAIAGRLKIERVHIRRVGIKKPAGWRAFSVSGQIRSEWKMAALR
ncbi:MULTISPECIES: hypothetical protein [unclassified Mesorhizobium]|uniref:hypothetical protein n=1 Tax=unclassified Mesorhizobium TaxID=325217 RepID=UPI00142EE2A4|nr:MULTISPECIES: hypothetical protein [unclassified Mesorhizobium]